MKNKILFLLTFSILFFGNGFSGTSNDANTFSYNGYTFINSTDEESDSTDTLLTPEELEKKAESLLLEVQADSKYIGFLANNQTYSLPVGLYKNIAGIEYTIVLDEFVLHPNGATLKAYLTLSVPGSSKKLGFYADNVRIGPEGIETAQLKLIRDVPVNLGGFSLNFRNDVTMVQWDCNGYQSTTIGGDVVLPSNLIKPVASTPNDSTVMGSFFANFSDFNDVLLGFTMEPFEVNGLPNFEFHPNSVFVDFSDLRNPEGIVYPGGYFPSGTSEQVKKLWRGIYITSFTVKLPEGLSNGEQNMEISAQNMLIDHNGITGNIFAANILSLESGNLAGWQFSVDTLGFNFLKNSFTGFKMCGEIKIPISEEENGFRYAGMIDSNGQLAFSISNAQPFDANLWGAHLTLYNNSLIEIKNINGAYKPRAVLHGLMDISLANDVNLSTFEFQEMVITSDAPYMTLKSCTMSTGLLAGFPVSVSSISFVQNGNLVGLRMQANVSFMSNNESGFGADGNFTIWAERHTSSGLLGYSYKNTQIHGFAIDVNQGPYQFKGSLALYQEHPTYGKGFKGMIDARFQPGISVKATAQFGKVNDYRYWYVDALAAQSSGIPIFSGVAIYGFGGGASYHMQITKPSAYNIPENYVATDTTHSAGISFSNTIYVPNNNYGLGLEASVFLGTYPSPNAVNGQVTFRIQFYSGGGVESISLLGDAFVASEIRSTSAPVRLTLNISYNFSTNTLYGVNEAYVNIPNILTGNQPNNKAGSVVFMFSSEEWYVHMGTPNSRIGLQILNTISLSSYLMVGTNTPPFPNPPDEMYSNESQGIQSFENGMMSTGRGFAFGSLFNADTGKKEFLVFYGKFNIGAGFDIMLKDFGQDAYCEGSNPPLGVNGWYALGQAYAFLSGSIGINFELFGDDQQIDILNISASAIIQAKLPNPSFFKGEAGGSYNILGGLLKGNCHFEFTVGNECVIMNANPLGNMKVIADISPVNGTSDVSVFITPQVAFNIPIDEPFELVDENNQKHSYRVKLEYFNVKVNSASFVGTKVWNNVKDVVSFETTEIYPSFTPVTVEVKVIFQVKQNGQWVNFTISGQAQTEEQIVNFTTGERPDYIPQECVVYTYPVQNMMNFHWKEHNKGYIKLNYNFSYLLDPEPDWQKVVIFEGTNESVKSTYTYDKIKQKLTFNIPENLSSELVYNIRISKVPSSQASAVDENVQKIVVAQTETYEQTEGEIEGERTVSLERVFYQIKTRTSKYATFAEKIDLMVLDDPSTEIVMTGIHNLIRFGIIPEKFDELEIADAWQNPIITITFDLSNNYWYNTYIKPLVYDGYPRLPNLTINWRQTELLGIPPTKAAYIYQTTSFPVLNGAEAGSSILLNPVDVGLKFKGVFVMYQDFMNMRDKSASAYYPGCPNASIYEYFMNNSFHSIILEQDYIINLKYIIPGENIVTTTRDIVCEI